VGEASTLSNRSTSYLIMTQSTSTTLASSFDPNSPQLFTTNAAEHQQIVCKLVEPYWKEIARTSRKIRDVSKNEQPKVHFLICENDQPFHIEFNTLGYSESEYHEMCFLYAIRNHWIRTDQSDLDRQCFRSLSDFVQRNLQKMKSHLLVVVVDGYVCCLINPTPSPTGYKFMRGL